MISSFIVFLSLLNITKYLRMDQADHTPSKFLKDVFQILLGPILNTLSKMILVFVHKTLVYLSSSNFTSSFSLSFST